MANNKLKEKAIDALRGLEENGGSEVNKVIKATIPTYSNT
jgi:Parkin co-regulated protein